MEKHAVIFEKGNFMVRKIHYESGKHVWVPPPVAANGALEQLRFAQSKRVISTHMFNVPRLFHTLFRSQLHKEADATLLFHANVSFCTDTTCEPQIIALSFPYARCYLWKTKGTPKLFAVAREMQKVWKEKDMNGSIILRNFFPEMG